MNLEEFSEDIQKTCLEEIERGQAILKRLPPAPAELEALTKCADLIRKWTMLWIDVEKRKSYVSPVDISPERVDKSEECRHEWKAISWPEGSPWPISFECEECSIQANYERFNPDYLNKWRGFRAVWEAERKRREELRLVQNPLV